jgi:hypothetical protein
MHSHEERYSRARAPVREDDRADRRERSREGEWRHRPASARDSDRPREERPAVRDDRDPPRPREERSPPRRARGGLRPPEDRPRREDHRVREDGFRRDPPPLPREETYDGDRRPSHEERARPLRR